MAIVHREGWVRHWTGSLGDLLIYGRKNEVITCKNPSCGSGVWLVDPLKCPKCQGKMQILAFIEGEELIEKILKHLGLWDLKDQTPTQGKGVLRNDFHR